MKKLSPFGKAVRKYRIDLGETQMEVAKAVNVSVAFLSAIETGKKNVPDDLLTNLAIHFNLSSLETNELKHLALASRKEVTINMEKMNYGDRELLAGFARKFEEEELDEAQMKKLREIFCMGEK